MEFFFFSSRRRHTTSYGDWSSDVCSSDLTCRAECVGRLSLDAHCLATLGAGVDVARCPLACMAAEHTVGERRHGLVGQVLDAHRLAASTGAPGSTGRTPG